MSTNNLNILLWSKAWQVKVGKIYKCDVILVCRDMVQSCCW